MPAFHHAIPVMFQHCDPAGIVFYPRYFEMMNTVVETFFEDVVGWPFQRIHLVERLGVPMGRIATEFHAPSRLGDRLDWTLELTRVGGASLDVTLRAACAGEARLTATAVLVLVALDRMRSVRWPDTHRATLTTCLKE